MARFIQSAGLSEDGNTITLHRFQGDFSLPKDSVSKENVCTGLVVDLETTGLDYTKDVIIEIGLRQFQYHASTGEVVSVNESYNELEDPGTPLSQEVQDITGLSDEMLSGKSIDWEKVHTFFQQSDLIIAHNAAFDRPFIEKKITTEALWACSLTQVDWKAKGLSSRKLEILIMLHGFFVRSHRAVEDVNATLNLLLKTDIRTGKPYFQELLDRAKKTMVYMKALNAPFQSKDLLKKQGYSWNPERRYWYKKIAEESLDSEKEWMEKEVYRGPFLGACEKLSSKKSFLPM